MLIDADMLQLLCLVRLVDMATDANMLQLFIIPAIDTTNIDGIIFKLFVWSLSMETTMIFGALCCQYFFLAFLRTNHCLSTPMLV